MKPVSIRFKCFGPYMKEQYIDFTQLEQNGLFLICGETGSGKTTILDAMCYALYGKSSGGLRGDMEVMRCKLAGKSDETRIEFIFDSNGERYQFVRSLKYGRKNLNDTHNCMIWRDGVFVPLMENPKATYVNRKAEELIGLTCEQFRQVVILPQGKFEKLLVSDSVEKEKILVSLFRADQWDRIAKEIQRRVSEQDSQLKQELHQINSKLMEYGCTNLDALVVKQAEDAAALTVMKAQAEEAEATYLSQKKAYEKALLENRDFAELDARENKFNTLQLLESKFDEEAQILNAADTAEQIRPHYESFARSEEEVSQARKKLIQVQREKNKAEESARSAEKALQECKDKLPEQETRREELSILKNAETVYRDLEKKKEASQEWAEKLSEAKTASEEAWELVQKAKKRWEKAAHKRIVVDEEHSKIYRAYLAGISSVLAEKLTDGEPCPVCGSAEHPCPARKMEGHVSEKDMESADQAQEKARKDDEAQRKKLEGEEQLYNEKQQVFQEFSEQETVARMEYELVLRQKIEGIHTFDGLMQRITDIKKLVEDFEHEEESLSKQLSQAKNAIEATLALERDAKEKLEHAQKNYTLKEQDWLSVLAQSGLTSEEQYLASCLEAEERQKRRAALIQFRTDLTNARQAVEEQKQMLEGRSRPDIAGMKEASDSADAIRKTLSSQMSVAESKLETLQTDAAQLNDRKKSYDVQRMKVDADLIFAQRLNGRSGVSLQRYVLGVMLTSITVAANHLLKNVHGGRYQLYRTNEVAGSSHKSGLELDVFDARQNERRSVTTLSGGEKFLVALSLAIGLSTVVQAQGSGVRLEAMFVDEGFGSLDQNSIHDALDVLQNIQRSSGIVGIISHVERLAETIPTKIQISKGENGNTCKVSC